MTTAGASEHWQPDELRINTAIQIAREILSSPDCERHLALYYSPESNYAGATFTGLGENAPNEINADDLLAVTTLSVDVSPIAIRRVLQGKQRDEISRLLRQIPADAELDTTSGSDLAPAMAALYRAVKETLARPGVTHPNQWVTASKICARKRPALFPVRDRVVVKLLGLTGSYHEDWPVFAALVSDAALVDRVDEIGSQVRAAPGVDVGDEGRLRILDVALWMHGDSHG